MIGPIGTNEDTTYTAHATTATTMTVALVEIATWLVGLEQIRVPASVGVAFVAVITPFVSVGLKKLGILSA